LLSKSAAGQRIFSHLILYFLTKMKRISYFLEKTLLAIITLGLCMSAGAQNQADPPADTIELIDGSVISGQLLGGSSAQIVFESDAAGKLSIPSGKVVAIESHQPVVLKLSDDRVIRAPSLKLSQGQFVVMTASGVQSYALADIDKINPEPWMLGQGYHWTGNLTLAWEVQSGNTNKNELDYALDSVWESLTTRYTLRAFGELDSANEIKTSDDYTVMGKSDRLLANNAYMGANLYLEADEFAHLKQRLILSGYYGKQWRSTPKFSFSTEPGLAYVSDTRNELETERHAGLSWSLDMKSNVLGQGTQSYLNQIGVWNLEDNTDIMVHTRIGIMVPLLSKIALNAEVKLEYDSGAPADIEALDQTFKFGLGYRW
jgi:putative salt-induced outer membrane protein YdiY